MRFLPIFVLAVCLSTAPALAKKPAADILGVQVGMTEDVARKKLEKVGVPESDLADLKQSWKLKDKRYGYLAIRYGNDWKVRWVSVFAAEKGKKTKYSDVGPLDRAKHTGRHIYTWEIPGEGGGPGTLVTARGTDPQVLSSLSISRPGVIREVDVQADLPDTMYFRKP
jgi:hypothetical protein